MYEQKALLKMKESPHARIQLYVHIKYNSIRRDQVSSLFEVKLYTP